ncbi:MAG TPA: family 78 glycoside hydrolase catalytic domain [Puia sp.]|nr:family 78 glycoside hydrolase catalytic domain [Puia sp.]
MRRQFAIALLLFFTGWDAGAAPVGSLQHGGNGHGGNGHGGAAITPIALKCNSLVDPVGVDGSPLLLSWVLSATGHQRGQYQTAYRIQVATTRALLLAGTPDLWDTKMVDSSQCNNLGYGGIPPVSRARCFWRVKVWDSQGRPSGWSQTAYWEMGLLNETDWKGKWIGDREPSSPKESDLYQDDPAPLLRREFGCGKPVKKAVMYVSGIGFYEASINGKRVGNRLLDPGWTDYSKTVLYSTYDVSAYLKTGSNCLGMMLGNGWYNPLPLKMWGHINIREALPVGRPKFILQLEIEYADGTKQAIVSDEQWMTHPGPVIRNSIYLGETYDARKEIPGWNKAGLPMSGWQPARLSAAPAGRLQTELQPPVRSIDTLSPVSVSEIHRGVYIVDFGRNFGGVIRLAASGQAGTRIGVRYGERLYSDGSLNVMTSAAGQIKRRGVGGSAAPDTAYAKDVFVLKGGGAETFQPRFTFHGFRYIEVTGYPGTLGSGDIRGLALCSDVREAGSFCCSDTLIDRIQTISLNTFRSNLFSVQSDCPHRERFGYGGDIVATCETFMDNFDMERFYEKTVNDFADDAQSDGGLPETAPFVGIGDGGLTRRSAPVEWGSVVPVLLDKVYQYYGNLELVRRYYPVAKNWVDFIGRHALGYTIDKTIGDHESVSPQLVKLSASAFYYYNAALLVKLAALLGKQEDVRRYSALSDSIRLAFIRTFVDGSTGDVGIHTAAAQAYALYFGLIPDHSFDKVTRVLLEAISSDSDHITGGIFSTKFLMEDLGRMGRGDLGYRIATQRTFPGWGYMIDNGATTLWEHWALSEDTYSHNHPMFGSISNWFYSYVAGIRPADDAGGYNKIVIQPGVPQLRWAKAAYHSVLGEVRSSWKKAGSIFSLDVTIPVNATATVVLPATMKDIRESGLPITLVAAVGTDAGSAGAGAAAGAGAVSFIGRRGDQFIFSIGSGDYHFTATQATASSR